jgi:hypothetical protein
MDLNTLEFLTTTVVSGVLYDIIKTGAKLTVEAIKEKFRGWLLTDTDLTKITERVNTAPDMAKSSSKYLEAFLEENADLLGIIKSARHENIGLNIEGPNYGTANYTKEINQGNASTGNNYGTVNNYINSSQGVSDPSKKS